MKEYKTVYAILNNELEKLYVSHEEKHIHETENEDFESIILVCSVPGYQCPINWYKNKKHLEPRLYISKSTVLPGASFKM